MFLRDLRRAFDSIITRVDSVFEQPQPYKMPLPSTNQGKAHFLLLFQKSDKEFL